MFCRICLAVFLVTLYVCRAQDNSELKRMYEEDQYSRKAEKIDWKELTKQDSTRRVRVGEMIKQDLLLTSNDFYHAAMIYQHGKDSISYKSAWEYSQKAFFMDKANENARWLSAASYDRYLLSIGKPQVYGTQFIVLDKKYYLRDFDSTKVSDSVRTFFGTRTIKEIKDYLTEKNGGDKGLLIFPKSNKVIGK